MPSTTPPPEVGATFTAPGACRFLVWAPAVPSVGLKLPRDGRTIPMEPGPPGYHSAVVEGVSPGDRYLFDIGEGRDRPDPASRSQPEGVHAASEVVGDDFAWTDAGWNGPELADYVIYELHVGTFTPGGTFDSAIEGLDRLVDLGVTAVELMPVAQFPGSRNWGYDGAYPFAVQASYGGPDGLKRFVDACHARGLAVVLDVVYNHLGPEGNYLREFGPYFTDQYRTPWGDALNFDGPGSDAVRAFFLANALMWQTDYHIDALRLDAVHAIKDFSAYHLLAELADLAAARSADSGRRFLLIAESDLNDTRMVDPPAAGGHGLDAMWSDEYHHALHSLLTGEVDGYYEDFGSVEDLADAYRDGYVYAGRYSKHRDRRHGNDPTGLEPWRFVVCAQNHDQVGNRARGDRLSTLTDAAGLRLSAGLVALSPFVPMLFMGEEYGETAPFLYFVSHGDPALVEAVRNGRREEFSYFAWQGEVPDPQDEATFRKSAIDPAGATAEGRALQALYRELLGLRRGVPALGCRGGPREVSVAPDGPLLDVLRGGPGSAVRIVFHLGAADSAPIHVPADGPWRKLIDSSDARWGGPGATLPASVAAGEGAPLIVPPRSFAAFARTS